MSLNTILRCLLFLIEIVISAAVAASVDSANCPDICQFDPQFRCFPLPDLGRGMIKCATYLASINDESLQSSPSTTTTTTTTTTTGGTSTTTITTTRISSSTSTSRTTTITTTTTTTTTNVSRVSK